MRLSDGLFEGIGIFKISDLIDIVSEKHFDDGRNLQLRAPRRCTQVPGELFYHYDFLGELHGFIDDGDYAELVYV